MGENMGGVGEPAYYLRRMLEVCGGDIVGAARTVYELPDEPIAGTTEDVPLYAEEEVERLRVEVDKFANAAAAYKKELEVKERRIIELEGQVRGLIARISELNEEWT